jgi:hypothetical protein
MAGGAISHAGTPILFNSPDLDRWEYPFNATLGFRTEIPTFGALGQEMLDGFSFDQRDAQFLMRFATDAQITPGQTPCGYSIERAVVRLQTANGDNFDYDPTYDTYQTYLPMDDPMFTPDADPGRPIEMYGVAFRGGFTSETFEEGTSTDPGTPFAPSISSDARFAYPIDFVGGNTDDVSNNVRDAFDPIPFAVAQTADAMPGESVPFDAVFEFELDVTDVDVQAYLREALDTGNLMLIASSLSAAQSDGGPGTGSFPSFYAKENIFGNPASLEIEITAPLIGDANLDGAVDFNDLITIIFEFGREGGLSDVNCSGVVDFNDLTEALFNFS